MEWGRENDGRDWHGTDCVSVHTCPQRNNLPKKQRHGITNKPMSIGSLWVYLF